MPARWIQTIFGTLVSAAVVAMTAMVWDNTRGFQALNERTAIIQRDLGLLKLSIDAAIDDRYRSADAARDLEIINRRFDRAEERLKKIEQRLAE